jgi:hypothetical protein
MNLRHKPFVTIGIHYEVVRPVGAVLVKLDSDGDDRRFLGSTGDVDVIPWGESPRVGGAGCG